MQSVKRQEMLLPSIFLVTLGAVAVTSTTEPSGLQNVSSIMNDSSSLGDAQEISTLESLFGYDERFQSQANTIGGPDDLPQNTTDTLGCSTHAEGTWFEGREVTDQTRHREQHTTYSNNGSDPYAAIREEFKSIWPTELWKANGLYTDEYLFEINPHWLQFPPPSPMSHYILGVLYTILMIAGVSGNCLVIFMFFRCKSLRTPANILVMNLAVSDCLMMLKMPLFIYNCIYLGPAMGMLGCQIYGFLGGLTGTTSIATLAAISLDRYFVVLYPLEPLKVPTRARARLCVFLAWTYGAIFSSMPLFGINQYVPEGYLTSCSFDYLTDDRNSRTFIIVFFAAAWIVPVSIISFCYAAICHAVSMAATYSSSDTVRKLSNQSKRSSRQEQQRRRTEIRLAIVVLAVVAMWLISWTPYATVALLGFSGNKQLVTPMLSMIPALLCKMASCVDPFMYAITHPRFRRELSRRWPCLCRSLAGKDTIAKDGNEDGRKRGEVKGGRKQRREKGKEEGVSISEEEVVMVEVRGSSLMDNSEPTSSSGGKKSGEWVHDRPWTTDGRLYRSFPAPGLRIPFGSWLTTSKKHGDSKDIASVGHEMIALQEKKLPNVTEIIFRSDFEPTTV